MDKERKRGGYGLQNAGDDRSVCVLGEHEVAGWWSEIDHNDNSLQDRGCAVCAGCSSRWWGADCV